ncbi:MAG: zinc metallopeptidase [Clostridia bacterium]|nr:zinc metallopeptidase [Clostridia bacterium]
MQFLLSLYAYGGVSRVGYGFDMTYLLLVVPALILSLAAQIAVKSAYKKMAKVYSSRGYTGAQAAAAVLRYYNIGNVRIEKIGGTLSDHFDPRTNVISLSESVYDSPSIASVGIACHEAGHAAQHALGYKPIQWRNSILPVCRIGSWVGIPLALAGYFLGFETLVWVGLLLYSAIMIFQLVTLPVEFDASRRAIQVIEETGMLAEGEELAGAKKVLRSAAMTYVASLAVTMANLLRFILIFTGRRKN